MDTRAAMHMGIQTPLQVSASNFGGYISKKGIVGSYRDSVFTVLGNHHTGFHSSCTLFIPINSTKGPDFSLSSPIIGTLWFVNGHLLNGCKVAPHCAFGLRC